LKLRNLDSNYTDIKRNNIKNMLFLLKIFSLLLAGFPFFQKFTISNVNNPYIDYVQGLHVTSIALAIIGAVILFWMTLDKAKKKYKHIIRLEIPFLFLIFTISIYANGVSGNAYKFLYLIIIITYTIELKGNYGKMIALLSSCLILIPSILHLQPQQSIDSDLALSALFIVIAWTLGYYVKLENIHIDHLTHMTNVDGLTGAYNHRFFHECLNKYFENDALNGTLLSLIMIDIDFFKEYNDVMGHRKGDELLINIVKLITENIPDGDLLFRYGGDEFCIILNGTTQQQALNISERIRLAVYNYKQEGLEHLSNKRLSVSIGVASVSDEINNSHSLIDKADSALYRAKYLRKNRTETYDAIWHTFKEMSNPNNEDTLKYVKTLISVIDAKDKYTYAHTERVAHYCELFANYINLSPDDKRTLIFSAYLHDLGKINISKDILISDTVLTPEEWNELKTHPLESVSMIEKLEGFDSVIPIVKHHHERYDGCGYPSKLKGEEIPFLTRILTIIDSFDAMTNKRPYQKTKTTEEGLQELIRCKGTQFDSQYVDLFVAMMKKDH